MGLDMYLEADVYVGAQHEWKEAEGGLEISMRNSFRDEDESRETISLPANLISGVTMAVGYWRKANAIHQFFVDRTQGGVDECQRSYVEDEVLDELEQLCTHVLANRGNENVAREDLPPQQGFFFGSNEVDDWYYQDMEETLAIIKRARELSEKYHASIYYQASW